MLALAGMAGATKPSMVRLPQEEFLLGACSFPVLIQPTAPDVLNFFMFSDGEIFGAGPFVGTATNLNDTRQTVAIHSSGAFSVVEHSDGSSTITSNGSVISSLFGTIFYGRIVIELDSNGNLISRTQRGTEEDLCAELAGP